MKVDELIQLIRTTKIDRVREFLDGIVLDGARSDLVGVVCRTYYDSLCKMFQHCNRPEREECEILFSRHSDINIGDTGYIVAKDNGLYAVELTKNFVTAGKSKEETRIYAFHEGEIKILPNDTEGLSDSTGSA